MAKKKQPAAPYLRQEFPKWKYARSGQSVIVQNPEQEAALEGDWRDHPNDFQNDLESEVAAEPANGEQSAPEPPPEVEPARRQRRHK